MIKNVSADHGGRTVTFVTSHSALATMAFPIPDHLPRNAFSGKGSSLGSEMTYWDTILSDISALSWDALTPERASLCVIQLSDEISATRVRIVDFLLISRKC